MQSGSQELLTAADLAAPSLIREAIERFGEATLRAYGGSMAPAIQPGDLLHVERRLPLEVLRGEVILFEREGRLFAHRVVRRSLSGVLQTRGDAHLRRDPAIAPRQLLGVVIRLTRDGRQLPCPNDPGFLGFIRGSGIRDQGSGIKKISLGNSTAL
jgi:hypothetical protein